MKRVQLPTGDDILLDPRELEAAHVRRNRYREARAAGLDRREALFFADGDEDVGVLRRCVANGWTGDQITQVLR